MVNAHVESVGKHVREVSIMRNGLKSADAYLAPYRTRRFLSYFVISLQATGTSASRNSSRSSATSARAPRRPRISIRRSRNCGTRSGWVKQTRFVPSGRFLNVAGAAATFDRSRSYQGALNIERSVFPAVRGQFSSGLPESLSLNFLPYIVKMERICLNLLLGRKGGYFFRRVRRGSQFANCALRFLI